MAYQRRLIDNQLDELFGQLPAILLDGPKAVGKTSTALQRAATVRRLDAEGDKARAWADPNWVTEGIKPILIDEWQRVSPTWDAIKRAVDDNFSAGQFLLTGSMPDVATHSGAGRINSIRMRPLSLAERGLVEPTISFASLLAGSANVIGETTIGVSQYCTQIVQSGFPGLRHLNGRALSVAIDSYIQRIIDADIPELGLSIRKPATLLAWLRAYAAATATNASWEAIRDSASGGSSDTPAKSSVIPYRDALTRLRILDELPAWTPSKNHLVKGGQASKHFLADPALAARLLKHDAASLQSASVVGSVSFDGPLLGRLFEALAALSIRVYAQTNYASVYHFREVQGRHEVDLVVQREDGKLVAIEVKLGASVAPADLRHLKWFKQQFADLVVETVLVYAGAHAYRQDGVAIIPLALLTA